MNDPLTAAASRWDGPSGFKTWCRRVFSTGDEVQTVGDGDGDITVVKGQRKEGEVKR
jgi:hypothetical protein